MTRVRAPMLVLRPPPLTLVLFDFLGGGLGFLLVLAHFEVAHLRHDLVVQRGIVLENVRYSGFLEDGLPRALRLASAAIDAFVGMNIQLVRERRRVGTRIPINTVHGADRHTGRIDTIPAQPRNDVGHCYPPSDHAWWLAQAV